MYQLIFQRLTHRIFEQLNQGNYEPFLKKLAPNFTHTFSGTHALGGTRHTLEGMRRWCERLFLLSQGLNFEIKNILVKGSPWNIVLAVEWIDRATPLDDQLYVNEGVHFIHLHWGRIIEIHAYLDTQKVEALCQRLAVQGISEAAAPPIED